MHSKPAILPAAARVVAAFIFAAPMFLLAPRALGQTQTQDQEPSRQYVGHFLIYAGFMYLDSPHISLLEPGVHLQAGMRWSRHISLGIDYSRATGNTSIGLNLATTALQNEINPLLAGLKVGGYVPANYVAALPLASVTQTLTAGPEFPYRRFNRITPYVRPSIGLIFEHATAVPTDFLTKTLVKQIAPTGMKNDTTLFYGFGGGIAFNFTKHFSLVVQADLVHDHLFPDLLRDGRNTVRVSIGPGTQFGRNITKKWGIPGRWD
jgi:hypothetical protein